MTMPDDSLHDLCHDLRSPLAAIRVQAQMLVRAVRRDGNVDAALSDRLTRGLEQIDQAVTTLNARLEREAVTPAGAVEHLRMVDPAEPLERSGT